MSIENALISITAGVNALKEQMNVLSVDYRKWDESTLVHLCDYEDLQQVPGEIVSRPFDDATREFSVMYNGVKFFCLLSQEELDEVGLTKEDVNDEPVA